MCGRYALHSNPEVVALQFGLESPPEFKPSYNVCPGTPILIVKEPRGKRASELYRWGLIPHWAKHPSIGNKLANARGETLAEKPAFRDGFRKFRCLVPASGYYEWKTAGGRKLPWYMRPLDAGLFGLAGITALWTGPQGPVRSASLITTGPNELTRDIHDRMPVIIPPEDYAAWLDRDNQDVEALKKLLRSYPSERMTAHAVSPRVNAPLNDDPALIEAIA